MNKSIIKENLRQTFISEATTPGISVTDKVKKDSAKVNKDGLKAYSKEIKAKEDKDTKSMAKNKFNYDDKFEKTYHDEMEIMNGQEMIQYDSKPDNQFVERVKQGIEGSSTMGNEDKIGNAEAAWGASSDEFGKDLIKRIKSSTKKRSEQTPTLNLRGRDIQAELEDTGHKPYAIEESVKEMATPKKPISDKNVMVLTNWVSKFGAKEAAVKLINQLSQTGMISDLPDTMEYGNGLNRVTSLLQKGDYNNAFHTAKSLSTRLEKKAMRDMMGENQSKVDDTDKKDTNDKKKKDFVPDEDLERTEREVEYGSSQHSDLKTENNNKTIQKESMKRLKFKTTFNGLGNALKLIPESYRVDKKEFEMTDGNETYKIRWEGTLNEGKAVVLTAADKKLVNEDINRMKALFGYKSQDTLGLVKGNARIDENKTFSNMLTKVKEMMNEGEDMMETETSKPKEGHWEEEKKKAPEATKNISTAKGTKTDSKPSEKNWGEAKGGEKMMETEAPAAKESNPDKAKSQAPEAKKHVSTSKGKTGEAKEGHWEDVSGGEKMMETETSKPKEGHWEDNVKGQAAEAKKHVHLKESEEDGFEDSEETEDTWNKADDEDSSSEMEPSSSEMGDDLPMDEPSDDEEEVSIPKPTAKGGAQLFSSESKGIYWIKGPGLPMNGMEVPNQFLSIASDTSKKASERAALILKKIEDMEMGDEGEEGEEF